jgi:hypothetical protein
MTTMLLRSDFVPPPALREEMNRPSSREADAAARREPVDEAAHDIAGVELAAGCDQALADHHSELRVVGPVHDFCRQVGDPGRSVPGEDSLPRPGLDQTAELVAEGTGQKRTDTTIAIDAGIQLVGEVARPGERCRDEVAIHRAIFHHRLFVRDGTAARSQSAPTDKCQ